MAAPINDLYVNATVLGDEDGTIRSSLVEATSTNEVWNGYPEAFVWFDWTPMAQCRVTFTVTFPVGGMVRYIAVLKGDDYIGSVDEHPNVYYNSELGYVDHVTFSGTPGIHYHIGISFYDADTLALFNKPYGTEFDLSWIKRLTLADDDMITISTMGEPDNGIIFNPVANEMWVGQRDAPNVMARINPTTGVTQGYVQYYHKLADGMIYDPREKMVWASYYAGPHLHPWDTPAPDITDLGWAVFDALTGEFVRYMNFPADHYGIALSTTEPIFYSSPISIINHNGRIDKFNSETGALIASFPLGEYRADVIRIVNDGSLWIQIPIPDGPDGHTHYEIKHIDQNTGAVLGTYNLANGDLTIQNIVYDPDSNSLWVFREFGEYDRDDYGEIVQFDLATQTVTNVYQTPSMWLYGYDGNIVYDTQRKMLWFHSEPLQGIFGISTIDGTETPHRVNLEYWDGAIGLTMSPDHVWGLGFGDIYRYNLFDAKFVQAIINDRDVWLQTFADRFTKVTVQPGSVISSSQANGTGIVLAGAKRLALNDTLQFFIVRNDPV